MQRFTTSVFPSTNDDVVTSPYNALLSLARLTEHTDCVLPVENGALQDICSGLEGRARLLRPGTRAAGEWVGPSGAALHCLKYGTWKTLRINAFEATQAHLCLYPPHPGGSCRHGRQAL